MTTSPGRYTTLPALELDTGDYVKIRSEWFRLVEREGVNTKRHQGWLLINKSGGRLHWTARIGDIVTAYVLKR
jgi:hypothetical protein